MSVLKTSTEEIVVHLVSPGVSERDYHLDAGATLADLLRLSGASMANHDVFLDGVPPEAAVPLHSGVVVTIVPRPTYAADDEPWRSTIPAFADSGLSQEYFDAMKARRDEANPDEESQDG